jgi:hypothetical protein
VANLNIVYYPENGKHSPVTLLKSLFTWLERFQNMYQVKQGNFRLYFEIIDGVIVISHVCRKVRMKALKQDLNRAKLNLQDYRGK